MSLINIAKNMSIEHNVSFRVLDATTGKLVREYSGHNQATNSMLIGIAHYLKGDGVLNQGTSMLSAFVPQYISLGTMGLVNQEEDNEGLPAGLGVGTVADSEEKRLTAYMYQKPGYGADGYDANQNNNRHYLGLGPVFGTVNDKSVNCELISKTFPRAPITYRQIVPETESELPETIDVIFSAMISTGALKQFREDGKDYIFITEAGLWSQPYYNSSGYNGLLAGYRIVPPDKENWDMTIAENRRILKQNVIKVNKNQVVQVIWKVQIGSKEMLGVVDKPTQCDCICADKNNSNPYCPCHGDKHKTVLLLDKHTLEMDINTDETLIATVSPEQPVVWSSSDESVALVSDDGVVFAIADGSTTITATATDGSSVYDSCNVFVGINIPIGDMKVYTMFAATELVLGARVKVYGDNIGVGGTIFWQASEFDTTEGLISGYSEDSKLTVWGEVEDVPISAPLITTHGGNRFDTNVYIRPDSTVQCFNQPEQDSVFKNGIQYIPDSESKPSLPELSSEAYAAGSNDIYIGQSELALMFESKVVILSKAENESYTDENNLVYNGYCYNREILSSKTKYGAYANITFESSKSAPAMLYVFSGKYAIGGITQIGNFGEIRYKGSSQSKTTVFYVNSDINLSNDTYISNDGEPQSCMIYCTGDFSVGVTNEMNLAIVAPNGTVSISNANNSKDIILYGTIYADRIVFGNDVQYGVKEVQNG